MDSSEEASIETSWSVGAPSPTAEELAVLSRFERFAFRLARRMNRGAWKRFWTLCQRVLGAGWIHLSTYNLLRVYGLEHVESASRERPLLLVANHRSFFDMYVVSTVPVRKRRRSQKLFFPGPVGCSETLRAAFWSTSSWAGGLCSRPSSRAARTRKLTSASSTSSLCACSRTCAARARATSSASTPKARATRAQTLTRTCARSPASASSSAERARRFCPSSSRAWGTTSRARCSANGAAASRCASASAPPSTSKSSTGGATPCAPTSRSPPSSCRRSPNSASRIAPRARSKRSAARSPTPPRLHARGLEIEIGGGDARNQGAEEELRGRGAGAEGG